MLTYFFEPMCTGTKIHRGFMLGNALLLPRRLLLELVSIFIHGDKE